MRKSLKVREVEARAKAKVKGCPLALSSLRYFAFHQAYDFTCITCMLFANHCMSNPPQV